MDNWSKESIGIIIASIVGAFIGTATKRSDKVLPMIVSVVAGISSAYIFTPIISEIYTLSTQINYAVAFLLGLLGMSLISIVLAVLESLKDNPKGIIEFAKDIFSKSKTTTINNINNYENKEK